ncbi:MAG TPA: F0F1 ATP synthase subunit B [Acidimicrobiales bacterium]|nr:F0F1 ATP synthase subunit B [Acidimicrobiales bacterium]
MRIRNALAALLLGIGLVMLGGTAVHAQTNSSSSTESTSSTASTSSASKPAGEAEEDCIKLLEQGKKIDDCQKAPSPILPATNELIWGTISFVVLFLLLYKFAWPALKNGMDARTDRIRSDLEAADTAKADAETVLSEYMSRLGDARSESARIIEEARQAADNLRRDQEQRLQTELAELRERAAADIEAAKRQAVADLRGDVAELAIGAAEVIVQRSLDRDTQTRLVDNYIEQVSSRSN